MDELFKKLDTLWNSSEDPRFRGENPECVDVLEEIEEKFQSMTDEEIIEALDNLAEEQWEQLLPVFEDMVDERAFMENYM